MNNFKDKRVLVTGATGFIGSHLVRRLLIEGAEVHILIREGSNCYRIKDVMQNLIVWQGELRDYNSIVHCIRNSKPQVIYHLAAYRNVKRDLNLVDSMIDTNVKGVMGLLKTIAETDNFLECFVNTGTCEEYGDGATPFHEEQREMPVSSYSASKVAATYFCQMVYKTVGLPIVTLRPFLTYGAYQDIDLFIPSLIYHCLIKKDFKMTEGSQTREFNYIDDIVQAYILAVVSPGVIGETINIGNGLEYRIKDVAENIVKMMGNPIRLLVNTLSKRPGETAHFYCDNKKAKSLLNWSPRIGLQEGLERTISWYKNNLEGINNLNDQI
jgi:nucleoside-diphosphate-sugar epimerase